METPKKNRVETLSQLKPGMLLHIYYDAAPTKEVVLGKLIKGSKKQRIFKLEGTDTVITFDGYDFNGFIHKVDNSDDVSSIYEFTDIAEPTNPTDKDTDPTPLGGKRRRNRKTKRRASRGKRTVKRHGKKRY